MTTIKQPEEKLADILESLGIDHLLKTNLRGAGRPIGSTCSLLNTVEWKEFKKQVTQIKIIEQKLVEEMLEKISLLTKIEEKRKEINSVMEAYSLLTGTPISPNYDKRGIVKHREEDENDS